MYIKQPSDDYSGLEREKVNKGRVIVTMLLTNITIKKNEMSQWREKRTTSDDDDVRSMYMLVPRKAARR